MQNMGIGREIMKYSEKRALELGFDSLKLFVHETNRGSIQFHKKIGYLQTGFMDDCLSFIKLL
jgi:L-amino acid N-acyltransferase YncA